MVDQLDLHRKDEILSGLWAAYEAARLEVVDAEKKAVALLEEYWAVKGEFSIGDTVRHPSLRPRNGFLWAIQKIEYKWTGQVLFVVQQETDSGVLSGGFRRVARDGLLNIWRRNG
jgi:hypothetical protein